MKEQIHEYMVTRNVLMQQTIAVKAASKALAFKQAEESDPDNANVTVCEMEVVRLYKPYRAIKIR